MGATVSIRTLRLCTVQQLATQAGAAWGPAAGRCLQLLQPAAVPPGRCCLVASPGRPAGAARQHQGLLYWGVAPAAFTVSLKVLPARVASQPSQSKQARHARSASGPSKTGRPAPTAAAPAAAGAGASGEPLLLAGIRHPQLIGSTTTTSSSSGSSRHSPAVKAGTTVSAICISAPVWGLRPRRAARTRASNTPNPGIVTLSPAGAGSGGQGRAGQGRRRAGGGAAAARHPAGEPCGEAISARSGS